VKGTPHVQAGLADRIVEAVRPPGNHRTDEPRGELFDDPAGEFTRGVRMTRQRDADKLLT
jgi:hypothetical protein